MSGASCCPGSVSHRAGNLIKVADPDSRLGGLGRRGPRLCGDRSGRPPGRQSDAFAVAIVFDRVHRGALLLDSRCRGAGLGDGRDKRGPKLLRRTAQPSRRDQRSLPVVVDWPISQPATSTIPPRHPRHSRDRIAHSQYRRIPLPRPQDQPKIAGVRDANHDRGKRHFCTGPPKISSPMWRHGARRSDDTQRSLTVPEREDLRVLVLTDESVSGWIVDEPRFIDDVGLKRDLVAAADQGFSSNRWREHPCMGGSHEEDGGPAPCVHPWRQARERVAAMRAARVATAMRAR